MKTLVDLLEFFKDRGQRIAFVYRTGVRRFGMSYSDLYDLSLKFARFLERNDVKAGDRVILWAPNSPWWAVCFWGCVARGAIVVPVDFMSDKTRAESIAELAKAKLIIQSQYKIDKIERHSGTEQSGVIESQDPIALLQDDRTFLIEELEYLISDLQPIAQIHQPEPGDTAELIYTSGTTGNPKGVILTHKNLITNILQGSRHINISDRYTFLSLLPLSHMFEQMGGFLVPFYKGAKIVYVRTLKPSAIMDALHAEDIYTVMIVPRLLQALKASIEREFESKHLGGVFRFLMRVGNGRDRSLQKKIFFPVHKKFGLNFKFFVSGGAALDPETFRFWRSLGFKVIEGYGLTECSPLLTANTEAEQTLGSVGRAVEGVQVRITSPQSPPSQGGDAHLSSPYEGEVQEGLNGEVQAKGENIFPGYWENEKATKEAFTEDGWFRTGDIGELDETGRLFIKGRIKEMIVTGSGINVFPDDIELILIDHAAVKEACVIGLDRGQGEEVHAVLILEHTSSSAKSGIHPSQEGNKKSPPLEGWPKAGVGNAEYIIQDVNQKLDTEQQITGFTLWPEAEFPKTSTLKVKKFEVKERLQKMVGAADLLPLQEDRLTNLIAKVTGKPTNEIREDSVLVRDLGLTSIARLELVSFIEQEFRLDMEDTAIQQDTTVAFLRTMIEKREKQKSKTKSHLWPHTNLVRKIQYTLDNLINWHGFRLLVKLEIKGQENLREVKQPVIFIANHESYLDGPCVYAALPAKWRYHLAAATYEDLFFNKNSNILKRIIGKVWHNYLSLISGIFLITESQGVKNVLKFMGQLVDGNVSILIFPECQRSWDGQILPFQQGLGLMVKELRVPVVPLKILGAGKLFPRGAYLPKRGRVSVTIGKPLYFTNETPSEIIELSREALINT